MARTDQELIDEVLGGALEAYDALMKRYERLVFKVAYGFGKDQESALDITQNVFIRAYNGLGSFRRDSNFKTWVARIAYNEGINWLRQNRRHVQGRQPLEAGGPLATSGADQEAELLRRERKGEILRGMQQLNEKYRLAVTLRYFQGMPIREVAEVLECSEGTAKSILFRSVRQLREAIAPSA